MPSFPGEIGIANAGLPNQQGEILTNHVSEETLRDACADVTFVRCAYFMENWAAGIETVQSDDRILYSVITPIDFKVPMVAAADIGSTCAGELVRVASPQSSSSSLASQPRVFELRGPREYSSMDVLREFEVAAGKKVSLHAIDRDNLAYFFGNVFRPEHVPLWVEMTESFLPGGKMQKNEGADGVEIKYGTTELGDVVKQWF